MYFRNLLEELEKAFNLKINDTSVESINLKINDTYHIRLLSKDNGQTVLIESDIYELEPFLNKDFYKHLLAANFEGILPWGANFGLNPHTNRILLINKISLEHINYDEFIHQLNAFINLQEVLQKKLYHWKTESFLHRKPSFTEEKENVGKLFI